MSDYVSSSGAITPRKMINIKDNKRLCSALLRRKFQADDEIPILEFVNYALAHFIFSDCAEIWYDMPVDKFDKVFWDRTDFTVANANIITIETLSSYSKIVLRVIGHKIFCESLRKNAKFYFRLSNTESELDVLIPRVCFMNSAQNIFERLYDFFQDLGVEIQDVDVKQCLRIIANSNGLFESIFSQTFRKTYSPDFLPAPYETPECAPLYVYVGSHVNIIDLQQKSLDGAALLSIDQVIQNQSSRLTYTMIKKNPPHEAQIYGKHFMCQIFLIAHGRAFGGWSSLTYFNPGFKHVKPEVFAENAPCGKVSAIGKFSRIAELGLNTERQKLNIHTFDASPPKVIYRDY